MLTTRDVYYIYLSPSALKTTLCLTTTSLKVRLQNSFYFPAKHIFKYCMNLAPFQHTFY